ncbi:MAG TPA: sugar phosphate isomerase/epimerase [Herpetosiphonaceae bacterium]
MKIDQVAVQLYTLRDLTASDMLGTLRQLAQIGYRAVELAGYGNTTPQAIRAELDTLGMRAAAAHVRLDQLEQADGAVEALKTIGCEYVVVPWVGEEHRGSVAQVRELAEQLNRTARRLAQHGLRLAYHNHQFEFAPLDGTTMWDLLVAETDPALVDFELDVYWAAYADQDPLALIERHGARLPLLHLKDRAADEERDAPVGQGTLPWEPILAASRARWYIVEQDHPRAPLADVAHSLRYLRGLAKAAS